MRLRVYCDKRWKWDSPLLRSTDGIEKINTSQVEDEVKGEVEEFHFEFSTLALTLTFHFFGGNHQ